MEQIDLTKLYQKQISLTEWFEAIKHPIAEALRKEDNDKRERLLVLNNAIRLPFDKPHQFSVVEMVAQTPAFVAFLEEHGDELCALRLIPHDSSKPKLRMRGHTVRDAMNWFAEQQVEPEAYKADFVPHPTDHKWSTIFVVRPDGVFGEIIRGAHHQLTQGFHDEGKPIVFSYDFHTWNMVPENGEALAEMKSVLAMLTVDDPKIQTVLKEKLGAVFANNILCGYFETVASEQFGTWFIDYNRLLGDLLAPTSKMGSGESATLRGQIGSSGCVRGRVRLVMDDPAGVQLESDEVLVCPMTTPSHIPAMLQAVAIVTDSGGILSHAAIVAREMKKPCIVGTESATTELRSGDLVEVDADRGIVTRLVT